MNGVNPLVANLWSLMRGLRQLGFDLGEEDLAQAVDALRLLHARDEKTVFDVLRILWCKNFAQGALFQFAFFEWVLLLRHSEPGQSVQETYLGDVARRRRQQGILTNPSWFMGNEPGVQEAGVDIPITRGASQREVVGNRRLERLTDEELRVLMALYRPKRPLTMASYLARPDLRGSRWNPHETMRRGREGSEWVHLYYDSARRQPMALTVLLDMSGSMAAYHRPLLQFLHAMMRHERRLAVYAFSTRLSILTPSLKHFHVDRALADVSDATPDRGGGTRIGASLRSLWERERGRGVSSRSSLVLVSDGFEEDDGDLDRWAGRWQRYLSGRLYWWNPFEVKDPGRLSSPSMVALARHSVYATVPNFRSLTAAWAQLEGRGGL